MAANTFGPMVRITRSDGSSSSIIQESLFVDSWKAEVISRDGVLKGKAEYNMLPPSGEKAFVHMLLDASGSTWQRVSTGDHKRVYEHLLLNFENMVECEENLHPDDMIYVWTFNKRTTLLCAVEKKKFHTIRKVIRAAYTKELDSNNHTETRLYDAVATVMKEIRETFQTHKKSDFFLVPFTDGSDNTSETTSLNGMMNSINYIGARLHTIFITANMSSTSELFQRLESQRNEITHINCENCEPNEIRMAFNTLRACIKAFLILLCREGDKLSISRIVNYGGTKQEVAEKMMMAISSCEAGSMLDGWHSLYKSLDPAP